jgi:N-acetyl-alpha-D-glucosaminyl L-malate synthase BshA
VEIAILCHVSAGGSGVVATELGVALAALGHQVHFIAQQQPFRLPSLRGQGQGIYFHQVGSYAYPLFETPLTVLNEANALASVILEHGIELSHAHYAIPHASSALMAKDITRRSKVLTTLHGTDVTLVGLDPAFRHSTRYAIEHSDAVTAVSHFLARQTLEMFHLDLPISVIPNMVDTKRFRPNRSANLRQRFADPEQALLVHISNFRAVKRTEDVVQVFARVASQQPARLLMIGDGPEHDPTMELAERLGVSGQIQFLGSFPSVEEVLGIADLFLLPSSQESFGLVALEAMSCEVPVIASRVGGLPEVVGEGREAGGILCPVRDVDTMADRAITLLADRERRQAMGRAGRQRARKLFRPDRVVSGYLQVYSSLTSG